jgi:uncharacterized membrane protein YfhO
MIMGLEKILNGQKPYILIATSFFCLCSSFYIFFMCSVFIVLYAIFYYFEINSKPFVFKKFISAMLKTGLYYLLAILLAAFFLLPLLYLYPTAARAVSKGLICFNLRYCISLFINSLTSITAKFYTPLGTNIIILALIIPFFFIKGNKTIKKMIIILGAGLFIPLVGYFFNLFNYVNNRWIFLLEFCLAVMSAFTLNHYFKEKIEDKIKKRIKNCLSGFILIFAYSVLFYLCCYILKNYYSVLYLIVSIIILTVMLVVFIFLFLSVLKNRLIKINIKISFPKILASLYILSVLMPMVYYIFYSAEFDNWEYFYTQQSQEERYISELNEREFFRTDTSNEELFYDNFKNNPTINEYMGTFNYNTLSNGLVYEFFNENGIYNPANTLGISGLNKRSEIESLLSVKYYLKKDTSLPYGFKESLENYEDIYLNDNYLPLGIVFNNSVSKEYYSLLSYFEKQALMLEAIVIDESADYNYTEKTTTKNYDMQLNDVVVENNIISVKEEGGSITLNIEDCADSELYLSFYNLIPIYSDSFYYGLITDKTKNRYTVNTGSELYEQYIFPKGSQMYSGQTDFSYNLGYSDSDSKQITITFNQACDFSFDAIDITSYDMNDFQLSVDKLKANSLNNVVFNNNRISGNITMDNDGYLFLSIPYSDGFTALVNGENTEIIKADTAFMALYLKSGYNEITLNYKTPMLNTGIMISLGAFALIMLIIIKDIFVLIKRNKKSIDVK